MYSQIVNPKTGRKVNIDSKIGKDILKNYLTQIGSGKNPHTGKEWSSYKCKGLVEDECEDMNNYSRCKWVEQTDKKKAHCRKSQNASWKRGKRNLKKLKEEVEYIAKLDLSKQRLSDDEINDIITNFSSITPDEGQFIREQLKNLQYNPNYRSKFGTGDIISKYSSPNPSSALYNQAWDVVSAYTKYDDPLSNDTWDNEEEPEASLVQEESESKIQYDSDSWVGQWGEPPTDEELERVNPYQGDIDRQLDEQNEYYNHVANNPDIYADEDLMDYDAGDVADYWREREYYDN